MVQGLNVGVHRGLVVAVIYYRGLGMDCLLLM